MRQLTKMLSYCRPAGSSMERQFIERYITPYEPTVDKANNRIITVGDNPKVMFSCHTDTVHHLPKRQKIHTDKHGIIHAGSKHSNCLGADDTAGVYVALGLIDRGIEGTYIFHAGEEIGCIGAKHLAEHEEDFIKSFDISIALDRRGTQSLVTAQTCMIGASDEFARAFCTAIGMKHSPDPTGLWTDNVEYIYMIPEIVNLSVGYSGAHSIREKLDSTYLFKLVDALAQVNYKDLPIIRDLSQPQGIVDSYYGSYTGKYDHEDDLEDLIRRFPSQIAHLLETFGFDGDDILDFLTKEEGLDDYQVYKHLTAPRKDDWWDDFDR